MYTFRDYVVEANRRSRSSAWRYGQALFNVLAQDPANSWIAEEIRGTDLDPFHLDYHTSYGVRSENIRRFLDHVSVLWTDYDPDIYNARIVMVLNDGETYTDLAGCAVVAIPPEIADNEVDEFVRDAVQSNSPSVTRRF